MTAQTLPALIDEVAKATEGSLSLDAKLLRFFNLPTWAEWQERPSLPAEPSQSVDSAIAFGKRILGEGWTRRSIELDSFFQVDWQHADFETDGAEHKSEAIATVLAALRAAAKEGL